MRKNAKTPQLVVRYDRHRAEVWPLYSIHSTFKSRHHALRDSHSLNQPKPGRRAVRTCHVSVSSAAALGLGESPSAAKDSLEGPNAQDSYRCRVPVQPRIRLHVPIRPQVPLHAVDLISVRIASLDDLHQNNNCGSACARSGARAVLIPSWPWLPTYSPQLYRQLSPLTSSAVTLPMCTASNSCARTAGC